MDIKRNRFRLVIPATILLLSSILVAVACGSGSNNPSPTTSTSSPSGVSFSKEIQPVFNNDCVVCHQGGSASGSLRLEPAYAFANLVGVQSIQAPGEFRVKAGAPDQSYLVAKLNGTQVQAGGNGVRMPYGAAPLSQTQIGLIQQWIEEGAKNN